MEPMTGYPIKIDDVLTAPELEALILRLSLQRAQMQPAVPPSPPDNIPTVRHASFSIDVSPEGITMNFRSNGFGWLAYQINREGCVLLRDGLAAYFPALIDPLGKR